jgi:hypothetical protein
VELFNVRGISSFPPAKRAEAIVGRIVSLAASPAFKPDALRIEETDLATHCPQATIAVSKFAY